LRHARPAALFLISVPNPDQNYEERRSPKLSTETKNGGLLSALPVLPFLVPGHLNGFKFALIRVPRDDPIFLPTALIYPWHLENRQYREGFRMRLLAF